MSKKHPPAESESQQEINRLQDQINVLKDSLDKELDSERLVNLAQQIHDHNMHTPSRVERIYQKKGFMHYWYVKMPAKVLNIASLADNQRAINDSIRAINSPICPSCGDGILMHSLSAEPVNGQVVWFCSKEPNCSFNIYAPPSKAGVMMGGINEILQNNMLNLGQDRWKRLTEAERNELIDSHLSKAILYRNGCILLFLMCVGEIVLGVWMGLILMVMMTALCVLISLKWGYRAWQIKTGYVYQPKSKFVEWVKTAPSHYSVDWAKPHQNRD